MPEHSVPEPDNVPDDGSPTEIHQTQHPAGDTPPILSKTSNPESPPKLSFFQMFFSTLAAMFGIQTKANLERDFKQGSAGNFVVIGIILVLIFIFTLVKVVSMVLENAGLQPG